VPCRRPGVADIGSTTSRGEATGFHCASANKVACCSGEDEEVVRVAHSSAAGHCHLELSYGGDTENLANAG